MKNKYCKRFKYGLTVKELKDIIKEWPEKNEYTGEDCEVWIGTNGGLSNIVTEVCPLNMRINNNIVSADLLLE